MFEAQRAGHAAEASSSICMVHDTIGWKGTGEYRPCARIDQGQDLRPGWRGRIAGHETDHARVTHQGAGDQEALGMRVWAMESHGRTTRRVAASERGRRQAPEGRETATGHDYPRRGLVGGDGVHAPAGSISAPCTIQDLPPIALRPPEALVTVFSSPLGSKVRKLHLGIGRMTGNAGIQQPGEVK